LSGLIGGIVGGILAWLVLTYAIPPQADQTELAALRTQVEDLSTSVSGLESQGAGSQDLAARVEALETREPGGDLGARIQAVEEAAEGTQSLVARIEALEAADSEGGQGGGEQAAQSQMSEAVTTLQERLSSLEQGLRSARGSDGSDGQQQVAQLDERLSQLAQKVEEIGRNMPQGSGDLPQTVDKLSGEVAASREQTTAVADQIEATRQRLQALGDEVGQLTSRLQQAEQQMTQTQARRERAAALALVVGQVSAALDQGRAYEEPLQTLKALGNGDDVISDAAAKLEPMAAQGVPLTADLQREFEGIADEVVHASTAPDGDGLIDRATGNLMRLVTVRPVGGDVEGEDAPALVARAEAKLEAGDLQGAVAELGGLKGAAAEAAKPWLDKAKARVAAESALSELSAHATDLLAQQPS
jgi:hypothetical protein